MSGKEKKAAAVAAAGAYRDEMDIASRPLFELANLSPAEKKVNTKKLRAFLRKHGKLAVCADAVVNDDTHIYNSPECAAQFKSIVCDDVGCYVQSTCHLPQASTRRDIGH